MPKKVANMNEFRTLLRAMLTDAVAIYHRSGLRGHASVPAEDDEIEACVTFRSKSIKDGDEDPESPADKLSATDKAILSASSEAVPRPPKILAKRCGRKLNSHFRGRIRRLQDHGHLRKMSNGYLKANA